MLPGALAGMALGWLLASHLSDALVRIIIGVIGLAFVANTWLRRNNIEPHAADCGQRRNLGRRLGVHIIMTQWWRASVSGSRPAAAIAEAGAGRHHHDLLRGHQYPENRPLLQCSRNSRQRTSRHRCCCCQSRCWRISPASGWSRKTPTGLFYQIAYVLLFFISLLLSLAGCAGRDLDHRQAARLAPQRKCLVERGDITLRLRHVTGTGVLGRVADDDAFGIANTDGQRARKPSATWRGVTP